jgi:hypothetical protein
MRLSTFSPCINPSQCENDGSDCEDDCSMLKEGTKETKCIQKRGSHISAQSARLRLNKPCRRSNFCTKEMYNGLALCSAYTLWVASPVDLRRSSSFDLLGKQTSSLALEPQSWQQDDRA